MSFITTIYGIEGAHKTPYRTKVQLPFGWRLHKFHRADLDRAWHDHPNNFWTFPFSTYLEEILYPETGTIIVNRVESWRWHYRRAYYIHRLIGREGSDRPHWTLVKEDLPEFREWGFYVLQDDGHYEHVPWRKYIFEGVRSWPRR